MPVDIFEWDELAGSGRGLLGRPIMPNNVVATRDNIATIQYKIINRTTNVVIDEDFLDVNTVMLVAPSGPNTWRKDQVGYTFNWPMAGTLIPDPNCTYQIVLTYTTINALGPLQFKRVYKANTKDPETL